MTIRDRTNPRNQKPRKTMSLSGGAPGFMSPTSVYGPPLDGEEPVRPGLPGSRFPRQPYPQPPVTPAPTPVPMPTPMPTPPLYPEPAPPTGVTPTPPVSPPPLYPEPTVPSPTNPVQPRPLYPEGPNMGRPGGPGSGQTPPPNGTGTIPPGYGLDFVRQPTPNELVANQLDALLRSDSPYMRNAEQRGMEYAASRGNINSSIGAGSARRAALEAAMPIAQADAQVYRDANAANFDAISSLRQMRTAADLENWLSDNSFNREYNGRLAMMPIQSAMDMMTYITQRALEDPAIYTPDVMSGFMNFFNQMTGDWMYNYFGGGAEPDGGE